MANVKVTSKPTKLGKELFNQAKQKDRVSFRVGIFGADDSTQVIKGAVHEFGGEIEKTTKKGKIVKIKIPARKWLTLAFERNRDYFNKLIRVNMKKVADGKMSIDKSNEIIAITLAEVTKEELGVNMPPPLKHRQGTPLVDTGDMRRAIGTKIATKKSISKTFGYGE